MASRTAWSAGNGAGFTWTSLFATGDLTSLASGSVVLSSATPIANQTNRDTFADLSVVISGISGTPGAGAYIALWLALLGADGSTYGDGLLTAGTQTAYTPPWAPCAIMPIASQSLTKMAGYAAGILLPPNYAIRFILGNFTGLALSATAADNVADLITANLNLNN
jgi:hypothetical protein